MRQRGGRHAYGNSGIRNKLGLAFLRQRDADGIPTHPARTVRYMGAIDITPMTWAAGTGTKKDAPSRVSPAPGTEALRTTNGRDTRSSVDQPLDLRGHATWHLSQRRSPAGKRIAEVSSSAGVPSKGL